MAVVRVKGNTVVAVPTVKYSLLSATTYGMGLMKLALCVIGFSLGMEVEHVEIRSPPGFAIFLSTYVTLHMKRGLIVKRFLGVFV